LPRIKALQLSTAISKEGLRRLNLSKLFTQCGRKEGNFAILAERKNAKGAL